PKVRDLFTKLDKRTGEQTDPQKWALVKSVGCDACNQTGFKGRIALFEAMEPDEVFLTGIKSRQLQTMGSEAVRLVAEGQTTIEEVMRILGVKYF
ncbi:MAG: hypothetical protein AAF801_03230, partial [Pseudomonadota bacterium]